jgi:endonuclease/exonuclease/phosphatase (EEP) superfamily protein YafD
MDRSPEPPDEIEDMDPILTADPPSQPLEVPARPPSRPAWVWLTVAAAWLVLFGALVVVVSRAFDLDRHTPFTELVVLTPWLLMLLPVVLAVVLVARAWRTAAAVAAVLAVVGVWQAPTLGIGVDRGPVAAGGQAVTVMTINSLTGFADAQTITDLVRSRKVDVLAVEELTPQLVESLGRAGLNDLLPYQGGRSDWGSSGTAMWSRWPLTVVGDDSADTSFAMPRRQVTLPNGAVVTVSAVHTMSPLPGRVGEWLTDLSGIKGWIDSTQGTQIVLGDFNATRDHAQFRQLLSGSNALTDSAEAAGLAGGAWPGFTWPADKRTVPSFMRLDHVLVTPATVRVETLDVVTVPGTDHRGLVATLVVQK